MKRACGPPVPLAQFKYASWVPEEFKKQVHAWLNRLLSKIGHKLNVGQVGILFGNKGLPPQEQHRDHADHHVVFLMRSTHNEPNIDSAVIYCLIG